MTPEEGREAEWGFIIGNLRMTYLELESVSRTNTVGSVLPSVSVRMQKSEESTLSSDRSWLCGTKV